MRTIAVWRILRLLAAAKSHWFFRFCFEHHRLLIASTVSTVAPRLIFRLAARAPRVGGARGQCFNVWTLSFCTLSLGVRVSHGSLDFKVDRHNKNVANGLVSEIVKKGV
jgi:hypothetical protein